MGKFVIRVPDGEYYEAHNSQLLHADISGAIIREAYYVHNTLGRGFLEKVYENALRKRLFDRGFEVNQQAPIDVYFEDENVGSYYADLIVEQKVIVELKSIERILPIHEVQLVNYLKATSIELGLILNFSDSVEICRRVHTKGRK